MNKVEAWKADKHGFDVWPDIERYAAAATPMAEIAEPDLERMKWYGFFYRKRVEDGRYMIRVRLPGCDLTSAQARAMAEIARIGYSILDVTTRGNVQVQGLGIGDLPGVTAILDRVGLTARQTGHDNVRNVMCHPFSGVDPIELIDVRPMCHALTAVFLDNRALANLPRKMNVAAEGRAVPAPHCWTQDVSFVAARRDDGSIGFHWLAAGTQGQNPRLAWKIPVWVTAAQAPDVLLRTLELFNAEGAREKRDRARLRYLIEKIGPDGFLDHIESRLGYSLERNDTAIPEVLEGEDFVGIFPQKQPGMIAIGVNVPLGRLTHEQMDGLADLCDRFGDGTVRTAYDQGVVLPNIAASHKHGAIRALNRIGLSFEADTIDRNVMSCTGRQFCNIAVSETKGHAFALMDKLRAKGVKLAGIKLNISGCPSSCAQTFLGDIGLKGVRVRRKAGTTDGFDVYLGGGAQGPVDLAVLYRKGVDVDQLPEMVEHLVRTYDRDHAAEMTFSQFWRHQIAEGHTTTPVNEGEFRPEIWICERCDHHHAGEDPPIFCPRCAGLRKNFARIGEEAKTTADHPGDGSQTPSDGFREVGRWADLKAKGRMAAQVDGKELAVLLVGDQVRCVDGLCPHEGGPMVDGSLGGDGVLVCPWHDWGFHTDDGRSADGHACSLKTYPTKVEDDRVFVAWVASPEASGPIATPRTAAVEVKLKVREVIQETPDTRTIRFDNSAGTLPIHRPGQHVKVGIETAGGPAWKSFTISSPPTRPATLDLTVKLNPQGVVSHALHALRPGDEATIKGPSGGFIFEPEGHREPLALVVAGSGITPAMSILRTVLDRQIDLPVTLLYGCRSQADIIFAQELDSLRVRLPNLRLAVTLSQPDPGWKGGIGRLLPAAITQHLPDPTVARYFLCGPGEFTPEFRRYLAEAGVPLHRVHSETFGKPAIKA